MISWNIGVILPERIGGNAMHLESYEVFCTAVDYGSITKAAQRLHMTQSTASRHLQMLEDEYGGVLLERGPIRITLTVLGSALYPYAADLISCHQRAKSELSQLTREGGEISVGATFSIGEYLLPNLLRKFRNSYPNVEIKVRVVNTSQVMDDLLHHRVDLGIVEGTVDAQSMVVTPWLTDELVLVCHPAHAFAKRASISLTDLASAPLLWREEGSGTRSVAEQALAQTGMLSRLPIAMELGSTQAIKSAIAAELGMAFLSRLTVQQECLSGSLIEVPIDDFVIRRTLQIVSRVERYRKYMVEQLLLALTP